MENNCDHTWMHFKAAEPSTKKIYLTFYCQKCLLLRFESYTDGIRDGSKEYN